MYSLTRMLEGIVEEMPDKGLKCENSQKVCFINILNKLDQYISGTTQEDLKQTES